MEKQLLFASSSELVRVPVAAVVCVVADGNYSSVCTADGSDYVIIMQLGQIEKRIAGAVSGDDRRFVRIGKSLIINRDYIVRICPGRQSLTMSDGRSFRRELSASKEALRALKDLIEKEES